MQDFRLRPPLVRTLAMLLLLLTAVVSAAETGGEPDLEVVRVGLEEEATLSIWNRPITTFRAQIGFNPPHRRAELAAERIAELSQRQLGGIVSVQDATIAGVHGYMVMLDTTTILSLVEEDLESAPEESGSAPAAALEGYANQAAAQLREVLEARARQQRVPVLVRGAALSLAATLGLVAWLWVVVRLRRWLLNQIAKLPMNLTGKRIFEIELGPQLIDLQRYLARLLAVLLGLIGLYVWITFVFSQFPYSEPWGYSLGAFLVSIAHRIGGGVVDAAPGLAMVAAIFLFTRFLVGVVSSLFAGVERGSFTVSWLNPDTARATRRLLVLAMWAFAATMAYPYIPGSNTDAFKGISVLLGLMISLGSTGVVNQIMSGLVVVYSGAIQPGEYVRFGQVEGTVSEVGLLATRVETPRRESVSIPNSLLVTDATVNYSRLAGAQGVIATTSVTIGYDAPWRQVQAMLIEAANRTPGVREEPAPLVRQTSLADFYVEYTLLVRLDVPQNRLITLSELHGHILDVFNEYGVQIMSPHFERQPENDVVVAKERWYAAPARREESQG